MRIFPGSLMGSDRKLDYFLSDDVYEAAWHQSELGEIPDELGYLRLQNPPPKVAPELLVIPKVRRQLGKCLEGDYAEYIRLFGKLHGLTRIGILVAHGGPELLPNRDEWYYRDGEGWLPVQEWVDEHDGKFACLMLCTCNSPVAVLSGECKGPVLVDESGPSLTARSKCSLLVSSDTVIGGDPTADPDAYHLTMFDPDVGDEIDGYTIEFQLRRLGQLVAEAEKIRSGEKLP
jgi:hypothetical protein